MDIKLQDSLAESLRWRCKESASETAIKFLDRQQTYAQFDSNANRVAQGLLSFEINPNSRVAYLAKNTDTCPYSYPPLVGLYVLSSAVLKHFASCCSKAT